MKVYSNLSSKKEKFLEKRKMDFFLLSSIILMVLFVIITIEIPDYIFIPISIIQVILGGLFLFRIIFIQIKQKDYTSSILTILISPIPIALWIIPKVIMNIYNPFVLIFVLMFSPVSLVAVIYYFCKYRRFLNGKIDL